MYILEVVEDPLRGNGHEHQFLEIDAVSIVEIIKSGEEVQFFESDDREIMF